MRKKKVLVLGDSHIILFNLCSQFQSDLHFQLSMVHGATAQGANKITSRTHALVYFKKSLIKHADSNYVAIMLGEVDCGFLIWARSKRENISVDEQINDSINNLTSFIKNNVSEYFKPEQTVVLGVHLPSVKDNSNAMDYRNQIDVDLKTRTEKTLQYNDLLKNMCQQLNCKYLEITEYILDITNVVKDYYILPIKKIKGRLLEDHHLDAKKTYKHWLEKFKSITSER